MTNQIPIGNFAMDIRIRIRKNEDIIYGAGVSTLLQKTDQFKSLKAAADEIGMSYKKALFIVDRAEKAFNKKILIRVIGGVGGGGSRLTKFGEKLVNDFKNIEQDINNYATTIAKKSLIFNQCSEEDE